MWEVIDDVFARGGVAAGLYFVTVLGFFYILRWLTLRLRQAELDRQKAESETEKKSAELRAEFVEEIKNLSLEYAEKLEAIQERRIEEARAIVEQSMASAATTAQSMTRLDETLRDIKDSMRRG